MVRKIGSEKWLEIALGDAGWERNGREDAKSAARQAATNARMENGGWRMEGRRECQGNNCQGNPANWPINRRSESVPN
jgi:hypothetical protein